jgi:hypothetical protein
LDRWAVEAPYGWLREFKDSCFCEISLMVDCDAERHEVYTGSVEQVTFGTRKESLEPSQSFWSNTQSRNVYVTGKVVRVDSQRQS